MGNIIKLKNPNNRKSKIELHVDTDSTALVNHLADLDKDLTPVTKGHPSAQWYGVIAMKFNLKDDTQTITILAAFKYEKHAVDFLNNLSPGHPGGYLPDEIIEVIFHMGSMDD